MKYCASRYANKITLVQRNGPHNSYDTNGYFDTWEEAHGWIIARLVKERDRFEKELRRAEDRLQRAHKMKPPEVAVNAKTRAAATDLLKGWGEEI